MTHYTGSVPAAGRPVDWRARAVCVGLPDRGEFFFDNAADTNAEAKALCRRCPSMEPCLQAALDEEGDAGAKNRYGIRGGQTRGQRRRAHEQGLTAREVLDRQARRERFDGFTVLEVLEDLYEEYTVHSPDGHLIWTGPYPTVAVRDVRVTVGRVAFLVGVGREPVGQVLRSCSRELCFLPGHLTDRAMRDQAAGKKATV